jgi:integrase
MSVFKLKDAKSRSLPWRAVVPRKGQPRLIKQFPTRQEAEMWEAEMMKRERLREVPEYQQLVEFKELAQHTVKDLVEYYIAKNTLPKNTLITLNAFLRDDICSKNLMELTEQDVNWFVKKKESETWKPPGSNGEAKPISPRTIRRLLNIVQRVFSWSIKYRSGFAKLPNPFRGVRIKGSTGGQRDRSLYPGELEQIMEACKNCHSPNNYYLPLAIHLAIDTAMRRQEIFNLTWNDIDDVHRRITIRKSKTDAVTGNKNVKIVLPALAKHLLITLAAIRAGGVEEFEFPSDNEKIFPMGEHAFSQAWDKMLKRAALKEKLHFHDLRREANIRFWRAGLTPEERDMQMRHTTKSMNRRYQGSQMLNDIQDKLDKAALGMTLDEAYEKGRVDLLDARHLHLPVRKG